MNKSRGRPRRNCTCVCLNIMSTATDSDAQFMFPHGLISVCRSLLKKGRVQNDVLHLFTNITLREVQLWCRIHHVDNMEGAEVSETGIWVILKQL